MRRLKLRVTLNSDAVTVMERLALVPWETRAELAKQTGLSRIRVNLALSKLEHLGLVETFAKIKTPTGKQ
jgi:hypothetical protein